MSIQSEADWSGLRGARSAPALVYGPGTVLISVNDLITRGAPVLLTAA